MAPAGFRICDFGNSDVAVDGVRLPGSKGTSRYAQHATAPSSRFSDLTPNLNAAFSAVFSAVGGGEGYCTRSFGQAGEDSLRQ